MTKQIFTYTFLIGMWTISTWACAQDIPQETIEKQIRHLSSDEFEGRDTGAEGGNKAADYIREHFKKSGLTSMPGADNYYQSVVMQKRFPSSGNKLMINGQDVPEGGSMLVLRGSAQEVSAPVVYATYGVVDPETGQDDYEGLDVEGKIVIVKLGADENTPIRKALAMLRQKRITAAEKGALALIELYQAPPPFTWRAISNYFKNPQTTLISGKEADQKEMAFIWVHDGEGAYAQMLSEGKELKVKITCKGAKVENIRSQNVVGYIEGTDEKLKEEYIFLTAHYDHIGTGGNRKDTIFNGARDNAVGTVGIMSAATYFGKNPPKRSVAFIAFTAEEKGLLGSRYYADNPLIPMEKAAYNLNIDGAGYNSTEIVTVIGLERTNCEDLIQEACQAYGLKAVVDPVPEQNLFDRSDNVSFAAKGVPAPTFSMGLTAFDTEIQKYYHQVTDEAESLDFEYLFKYTNAFIKAAELIGNKQDKLRWKGGDKYEAAYQRLHKNE